MDDAELEAAFTELDSDASGSIDFDELFEWLNCSAEASHKGAAQAALRASLTRRLLVRRAKAIKSTVDSVRRGKHQPIAGVTDVEVSWTWGSSTPLAAPQAPTAIGATITAGGPGQAAQVQDTDATDEERAALQVFLKLAPGVSDEEVAAFVTPLNAFMAEAIDAMKEEIGEGFFVTRGNVIGPIPLPRSQQVPGAVGAGGVAAAMDQCIAVQVFLSMDPIKPALQMVESFSEAAASSLDDEGGSVNPAKLVQRLLERFVLTLKTNTSMAQLLGLEAASEGGHSTSIALSAKIAKRVLSAFNELVQRGMLSTTSTGFEEDAGDMATALQHALSVNNVKLHGKVSDEERIAAVIAARMAMHHDRQQDFAPVESAVAISAAGDPLAALRMALMQGIGKMLVSPFAEAAADAKAAGDELSDELKDVMFLLTGLPEGHASAADTQADDEKDVSERGWRVLAWVVRWLVQNAPEVHTVRLAGRGLGVCATLSGLNLAPVATFAKQMFEGTVAMQQPPVGEEGVAEHHVHGRIPIMLLVSSDPHLVDAVHAWCAPSGTHEFDKEFEIAASHEIRTLITPTGRCAVVESPASDEYKWRSALAEGNTAVFAKAVEKDDTIMDVWEGMFGILRHKPRCVVLGVLRASDLPALASPGSGSGGAESGDVQRTASMMRAAHETWVTKRMESALEYADSAVKKARLAPWFAVLVHEDVPVGASAKAGALAAVQAALDLPSEVPLHVAFGSIASGAGIYHGLGSIVDAAVDDHESGMTLFLSDETE
jgi:hypothetical protein